jgi:hypothetical protein
MEEYPPYARLRHKAGWSRDSAAAADRRGQRRECGAGPCARPCRRAERASGWWVPGWAWHSPCTARAFSARCSTAYAPSTRSRLRVSSRSCSPSRLARVLPRHCARSGRILSARCGATEPVSGDGLDADFVQHDVEHGENPLACGGRIATCIVALEAADRIQAAEPYAVRPADTHDA